MADWAAYLDTMNSKAENHMTTGGIYGDDGSKWAGRGTEPTAEEIQQLKECCCGNDLKLQNAQANGVMIAGQKFRFIKNDKEEGTIDACSKTDTGKNLNVTGMKTVRGLVLCVTEDDKPMSKLSHNSAFYVGKYLKDSGY